MIYDVYETFLSNSCFIYLVVSMKTEVDY